MLTLFLKNMLNFFNFYAMLLAPLNNAFKNVNFKFKNKQQKMDREQI